MRECSTSKRGSRVGAIAAVLCYGALDLTLQGRYRLAPRGAVTAIGVLLIVLLVATYYVKNQRWRHIEWIAMRLCIVTSMILNAANLADVVQDVLFDPNLGFTTATAFSPTEAKPLTSRVKALMVVQSLVSLVTIIIVAARATGSFRALSSKREQPGSRFR
jgi:hypothetical protein